MGWLADLLGGPYVVPKVDALEDRLDDFVIQSNQACHDLAERLTEQTAELINMIDVSSNAGHERLGELADMLETESTDEFGPSGWWPKGEITSDI